MVGGSRWSKPVGVRVPVSPPRKVHQSSPILDIANAELGKFKIKCFLKRNQTFWGKHEGDSAAVFHFTMQMKEPSGSKLGSFELTVSFIPSEPASVVTVSTGIAASTASPSSPCNSVFLLDEPQPAERIWGLPLSRDIMKGWDIGPEIETPTGGGRFGGINRSTEWTDNRSWRFEATPDGEDGLLTSATWTWEANPLNTQVEDRKVLYGGVAIRHDGQPFTIQCHVEGRTWRAEGSHKFGIFSSDKLDPSEPRQWTMTPKLVDTDIKCHIDALESEMKRLNTAAPARKLNHS